MFEIGALLLSGFILFVFGVSLFSLTVIAGVLVVSFLLLSVLSIFFKFGFWLLIAIGLYYFLSNKKKKQS